MNVSREEIVRSHWRYGREVFFPESAIEADLSRQACSVFPCHYYVDILKECRSCGRRFLFFAREQQYWYEGLGFTLDADCVECPECRKTTRRERHRWQRYCRNVGRGDLDDSELTVLIEDAVELFAVGRIPEQRLRGLKNLAARRLPAAPATQRIIAAVSALDQQHSSDSA